jgi:hypothetical protein
VPGDRKIPDPDPRPLEVHQDRGGISAPRYDVFQLDDPLLPDRGGRMGGVDPDDIDTGIEQSGHLLGLGPGRPQRGDDLGAANSSWHGENYN